MSSQQPLNLLRSIVRELRHYTSGEKQLKRPLVQWILSEYRANQLTQAQYCRGPSEMIWVADTYLQYIRGQRVCRELIVRNHRSEKSVKETAAMVGFSLPPNPNDKTN
ncbi:protein FMC1 homolog [Daktulosphaira vitifoliae]|uniref:protein FMC1 homolog n=1 Tax=Daktulosphaira vitifoliae TaxID=58002 RepID=UPI0021AA8DA5|nr:protein FMC1 homolog [Daktulosphaira vitifoliae]